MRLLLAAAALCAVFTTAASAADDGARRGRALFVRTWTPGDPRAAGGDGLGPLFNASSCVACHAQAGVGGAGPAHLNVILVDGDVRHLGFAGEQPVSVALAGLGLGFGTKNGAVAKIGRRNAPALFGAGLIDAIPDDAITAGAGTPVAFPEISGEVPRTPEGRVAKLGWKGDVADLATFVTRACAVELGLEVPGAPQPALPDAGPAPGYDLALDDVVALTSFVSSLPRPERQPLEPYTARGEAVFEEIGCAACHVRDVGGVDGLYSDLLLHDMGEALADGAFSYGAKGPPEAEREWRTPPLWGVRDSGPWLHDGRAPSLESAIAMHGGEAALTVGRYATLPDAERRALIAFLETLTAPGAADDGA